MNTEDNRGIRGSYATWLQNKFIGFKNHCIKLGLSASLCETLTAFSDSNCLGVWLIHTHINVMSGI